MAAAYEDGVRHRCRRKLRVAHDCKPNHDAEHGAAGQHGNHLAVPERVDGRAQVHEIRGQRDQDGRPDPQRARAHGAFAQLAARKAEHDQHGGERHLISIIQIAADR